MKILLFKGKSFFSRAIIWFMRGQYSHVAVQFDDGTLYEADALKGVRKIENWKPEADTVVDFYETPMTQEQVAIARDFYERHVGSKYDFKAILGFLLRTNQESRTGTGRFFCGEYIYAGIELSRFCLLLRIPPFKVDPEKFSISPAMKFLNSHPPQTEKQFNHL